jgi:hypothetical protein
VPAVSAVLAHHGVWRYHVGLVIAVGFIGSLGTLLLVGTWQGVLVALIAAPFGGSMLALVPMAILARYNRPRASMLKADDRLDDARPTTMA